MKRRLQAIAEIASVLLTVPEQSRASAPDQASIAGFITASIV
jgi:hypothetical protein